MDYDEALSEYLDTYEVDEIFNNYFTAIRKALIAGYKAASGEMQIEQKALFMKLEVTQDKQNGLARIRLQQDTKKHEP